MGCYKQTDQLPPPSSTQSWPHHTALSILSSQPPLEQTVQVTTEISPCQFPAVLLIAWNPALDSQENSAGCRHHLPYGVPGIWNQGLLMLLSLSPSETGWDLGPKTLCCSGCSACTWTNISLSNKMQRNQKGLKNNCVHAAVGANYGQQDIKRLKKKKKL